MANGLGRFLENLAFVGSGMATGNVGASLAQLNQMRAAREQLMMQQQMQQEQLAAMERERQAAQAEQAAMERAGAAAAEGLGLGEEFAAVPGMVIPQFVRSQMPPSPLEPTSLQQNLEWAMGLPEGDPLREAAIAAITKPQTQVNVGGASELGAVPSAMARIEDPTSPTGTRLVEEPGAPAAAKREKERKVQIAPLNTLQDSLNRYRAALEKHGPEIMIGEGRSELETTYTDFIVKQKEAANLGALTGEDLRLMESMAGDPTSLKAQILEKTGNTGAMFKQLDLVQKILDDARARVEGREPERFKPPRGPDNPATITNDDEYDALNPGDHFIGPDGVLRVK